MLGEPNEEKTENDTLKGLESNPRYLSTFVCCILTIKYPWHLANYN